MENTENKDQASGTSTDLPIDGKETGTPPVETKGGKEGEEQKVETPFRTFRTQEEFDRHSAGILNSAKNKAEKELLAKLGLKPDEINKLEDFKKAYDDTLSDAEKQAKNIENLTTENESLKSQLAEKEAIISALSKLTDKNSDDVQKYVKMAKGLVDENTTIEQALDQVLSFMKVENNKNNTPAGKPLETPSPVPAEVNPFDPKTENLTQQGILIKSDREKAREMYTAVHGHGPSW